MCTYPALLCIAIGELESKQKHKEPNFPTLDEFLTLLAGGVSYYQWLCHKLIPFVVGFQKWNKRYLKEPLLDAATCSDETFVLLTLENNYQCWKDKAAWWRENKDKGIDEQSKNEFAPSKYTNSGQSKPNGRSCPSRVGQGKATCASMSSTRLWIRTAYHELHLKRS